MQKSKNVANKNKILSVVGARPNFMKVAPIHKAFQKVESSCEHKICHTGQHYDTLMSDIFFDELDIPTPDFFLNARGGTHAKQTATIMLRFEKILQQYQPDVVLVPGDVNSTLACSLTAVKLGIKVGHIEAGLRSFDRSMPEEINRIVTDAISDYLFVTENSGLRNLKYEGVADEKIFFVGNTMIDNLIQNLEKISNKHYFLSLNLKPKEYIVVTFHRPSNVDNLDNLNEMVNFLNEVAKKYDIVFPIHPRTLNNLKKFHLLEKINTNVHLIKPLGYINFLSLVIDSKGVVTDSGGIQEETCFLRIPCITVRNSTERPVTVEMGTNQLVGSNFNAALKAIEIFNNSLQNTMIPPLWDGKTSNRIVEIILHHLLPK